MDYDIVLLVLVCLSCLAGLAVALTRIHPIPGGWIAVYTAILLIAIVGWVSEQATVIYCAAAIWLFLAVLPGLIGRLHQRRLMQQQYATAYRLARVLSWLHPADGWRELPRIVRAFDLAQQGDITAAVTTLQQFQEVKSAIAMQAVANLYRITSQWEELLAWQARRCPQLERNLTVLPLTLRARGEVGDINGMVELYACRRQQIAKLLPAMLRDMCRLMLFAFCGRRRALEKLLGGRLSVLPESARTFWLATADLAACDAESANRQWEAILPSADPLLRRAIERRLTQVAVPKQPLAPEVEWILDAAERDLDHEEKYTASRSLFSRRALATQLLIVANLAMFVAEACLGGSQNTEVLYGLGALESQSVLGGQWWRLFTPLFLHWGLLHLAMNMLGLWLLGPVVEFALGFWRFLLVYQAAGIGSSAAVLLVSSVSSQPTFMVGASGCIMGLIGAMAAMMLRGWTREKALVAKRRLTAVLLFVVVQTASDAIIPHISMTAHLSGAVIGFAVTAILLPRMRAEK